MVRRSTSSRSWPFPTLPVSVAGEATVLLCFTLGLLFMPKLFGIAVAAADRRRRRNLGGVLRIVSSAVVETFLSALVAPIMMLFHTNYVATTLLGSAIEWKPQRRQASGGAWSEAIRTFGGVTLIGLAAAVATYLWTPLLFFWLIPVFAGLVLAIPLAVYTGSDSVGHAVRSAGLLSVEEENDPPPVMQRLEALLAEPAARNADPFTQVVLDPAFNALHIAMLEGTGGLSKLNSAELRPAERKAVYLGPSALSKAERRMLLENPGSMGRLHLASWVHWPGARRLDWEIDDHHSGDHRHAAASASRAAA